MLRLLSRRLPPDASPPPTCCTLPCLSGACCWLGFVCLVFPLLLRTTEWRRAPGGRRPISAIAVARSQWRRLTTTTTRTTVTTITAHSIDLGRAPLHKHALPCGDDESPLSLSVLPLHSHARLLHLLHTRRDTLQATAHTHTHSPPSLLSACERAGEPREQRGSGSETGVGLLLLLLLVLLSAPHPALPSPNRSTSEPFHSVSDAAAALVCVCVCVCVCARLLPVTAPTADRLIKALANS